VLKDGQVLRPSGKGRMLAAYLEQHFKRWVDYTFSSDMEEQLDVISRSQTAPEEVLKLFWSQLCRDVAEAKDTDISKVGSLSRWSVWPFE
jgi:DNA topoisomerase I